jgi:hypothetical protein
MRFHGAGSQQKIWGTYATFLAGYCRLYSHAAIALFYLPMVMEPTFSTFSMGREESESALVEHFN